MVEVMRKSRASLLQFEAVAASAACFTLQGRVKNLLQPRLNLKRYRSKRPAWLQAWTLSAAFLLWTPVAAPAEEPISLSLPIACHVGATCFIQNYMDDDPASGVRDYNCGERTYDRHDGTDIRLPSLEEQRAGVDVIAAATGTVIGVRDGMADISIRDTGPDAVRGR